MSDAQDIVRIFVQEGQSQLEEIDALLLRFESGDDDEVSWAECMRLAHNFKGAAGTAGIDSIAALAHVIEEALLALEAHTTPDPKAVFDALFECLDTLQGDLPNLEDSATPAVDYVPLRGRLASLLAGAGAAAATGASASDETSLELGEYDGIRIKVLVERGLTIYRLDLELDPEAATDTAWSLLQALTEADEVVASRPSEADLEAGVVSEHLTVLLGTERTPLQLRELLVAHGARSVRLGDLTPGGSRRSDRPVERRADLRIDLARVDRMLDVIGELVVSQSMLVNVPELGGRASRRTRDLVAQMTRTTRELQDLGMRMRMVPLHALFHTAARSVRDLARQGDKSVRVEQAGAATEMDRAVVERIRDPLVHLLRNAVDHGIESPEARRAAHKDPVATIHLSADYQGGNVVIRVTDDGRGLDLAAIEARGRARGLVRDGVTLSREELKELIFEPGFSTAASVTELSGRGVGLDVVRRNIEALRGRVLVTSEAGRGTTFSLVVPLTLAIIDGTVVSCRDERYILPTQSVVQTIRPRVVDIVSPVAGQEMLRFRESLVPLVRLGRLFGVPGPQSAEEENLVSVVDSATGRIGLMIDAVLAQQQVVIKSVGSGLEAATWLSGAAILPDGNVGLIVNVDEISAWARTKAAPLARAAVS